MFLGVDLTGLTKTFNWVQLVNTLPNVVTTVRLCCVERHVGLVGVGLASAVNLVELT